MSNQEIRLKLEKLLANLKRNKEKVPVKELKTKYKKGYESLCKEISEISSLFVRQIIFDDLRIHKDLLNEVIPMIDVTIQKSGHLKKFSVAAFSHQDMKEMESLAQSLRELILEDLEPFYAKHICLYITDECFQEPFHAPLLYNAASGCIWEDGKWSMLRNHPSGVLLYIHEKTKIENRNIPNQKEAVQ